MQENRKKLVVFVGIFLFLVTIALVGLTYAYYKTRIVGNTSNEPTISVTSKKMEIVYRDGSAVLSTTGPISPGWTATKYFSIENTGNEPGKYSVILDNIENTFKRTDDWTYKLTNITTGDVYNGTIGNVTLQTLVNTVSIENGVIQEWKLELLYDSVEDQSEDMGASLSFRVNIAETTSDIFSEGSFANTILTNSVLSSIDDNFTSTTGKQSYYFSGNVTDNYVNYRDMCWRIVRIQGDGTVKLVLADENNECDSYNYSFANSNAFINDAQLYGQDLINGSYSFTKWNYSILELWALNNLVATEIIEGTDYIVIYDNRMDLGTWCDDQTISRTVAGDYVSSYFAAYDRSKRLNGLTPSLKCDETNATTFTKYISLLTADEISLAGSYLKDNTYEYYGVDDSGYDSSTHLYSWTISPGTTSNLYDSENSIILYTASNPAFYTGALGSIFIEDASAALRPAIVLKSDVVLNENVNKEQNGTQKNPYVID